MMQHVAESLSIIEDALGRIDRPSVAFSGGKDSTVLAHMVHRVDPSVDLFHVDDELLHPEIVDYIDAQLLRFGSQLRITPGGDGGHGLQGGWFRPWSMPGPYWREARSCMEYPDMTQVRRGWQVRAEAMGYDAVFLGMRRNESERRHKILSGAGPMNVIKRILHVNPIIDWSIDDVWEYIHRHALPYCGVYDVLTEIGVKPRLQRVGPLAMHPGNYFWKGWPDMYVRAVQRYGKRWAVPRRRPRGMDMLAWLDLQEALKK